VVPAAAVRSRSARAATCWSAAPPSCSLQLLGQVDTSGGAGNRTGSVFLVGPPGGNPGGTPAGINIVVQAGAGSTGCYRLEVPNLANLTVTTTPVQIPAFNPAQNAGVLSDRDVASGGISTWRSTRLLLPPAQWLRYEMTVDPDGAGPLPAVVYSDDNAVGPTANDDGLPVRIRFQGASVSQTTGLPLDPNLRPWRDFVGDRAGFESLDNDGVTGFRFMLVFNNGAFPAATVTNLRVLVRT
jgi:hypothetical protein